MEINQPPYLNQSKVKIALSVTSAIALTTILGSPELLISPMADTDIGKYYSNRFFDNGRKQFFNQKKVLVKQIDPDGTEIYLDEQGKFLKQKNIDESWIYDENYSQQKDFHLRL